MTYPLRNLAHNATSPAANTACTLLASWHRIAPNLAVWAGTGLNDHAAVASHILVLGVEGVPTGHPHKRVNPDDPFWYIREAVGGRRDTPIPVTEDQAVEMVKALNTAAMVGCPAPDLLALTGWCALSKHGLNVAAAVASRKAPTERLRAAQAAFLRGSARLRTVA